ncbi:hypothetical protein ABES25_06045 [Bacillus gobiensis]|uniref:hypothetical protein n=1 Tax=Bacillus gobiensis TaxID=1441095 RepID=UPI003D20619A
MKTFQELESMSLPELNKYSEELADKANNLHKGSEEWYFTLQHDLEVMSVIEDKMIDEYEKLGSFDKDPEPEYPSESFSIYDKPKDFDIHYNKESRNFFVVHKLTGNDFIVDFRPEVGFHVQAEALELSVFADREIEGFLYSRSEDDLISNQEELTEGEEFYFNVVLAQFTQVIHYLESQYYIEQRKQAK